MPLVFVYGTLMLQGANHGVLRRLGATFVTAARTRSPRVLVDLGPYPAMLPASSPARHVPVHGEVWELGDAALAPLDAFEGCPDLYRRERIALVAESGDLEAFTYVMASPLPRSAKVIASGRYGRTGAVLPNGAAASRPKE